MQEIIVIAIVLFAFGITIFKVVKSFIKPKTHCSNCNVSGCSLKNLK